MTDAADEAEEVEDETGDEHVTGPALKRVVDCHHPGQECPVCKKKSFCEAPTKGKSNIVTPEERWARARKRA